MTALVEDTSAELASRATTGDPTAFAALVRRCEPLVNRWAVALCGDPDEADDIAAGTLAIMHRQIGSYRGDGPFDGWLYRITRRVTIRSLRTSRPRLPRAAAGALADPSDDVYVTDPGARVDRDRTLGLIREISTALPLRQREVFVLCDLEGRSPMEVAELLALNPNTVRANLFKARAAVRRSLLLQHPRYLEHRR